MFRLRIFLDAARKSEILVVNIEGNMSKFGRLKSSYFSGNTVSLQWFGWVPKQTEMVF